ncbi:MAG: 23S rRNA (adenine(2503)-C(2))-methyltransferase RlmN [Bacteroidales bacterium]|nr:23S rRNA (adenine(2503)-C(2))-methyltransferase RlmN [Bacteroidales bacterium]
MKTKLLGKSFEELGQLASECGLKPFVGRQIAEWLYVKRASSWDRMTNVSKAAKALLSGRFELGTSAPVASAVSQDGTAKYLFEAGEGFAVEAVVIPDGERNTLCVSTQAGCRMGCRFCMTGRQGWHGNLDAASILNQFLSVPESEKLTNAVFMGMGEPLDNYDELSRVLGILTSEQGFGWSPKRITVSTIGVLPVLRRLLDEQRCHVAVSLHNPFDDERAQMMPSQKAWPIREVVSLLKEYDFTGQRRVSFEYTMFDGWNDDKRHADALIRLLSGLECRVNLIRFHRIPDFPYGCSPEVRMEAFKERLNNHGILCTIRTSRGEDILAACGLLAGRRSE